MSEELKTKPTGMPEIDGNAFQVTIRMHTNDAQKVLSDPGPQGSYALELHAQQILRELGTAETRIEVLEAERDAAMEALSAMIRIGEIYIESRAALAAPSGEKEKV